MKPMILENLKLRVFANEIRNNSINMSMANDEQDQLLRYINSKTKPCNSESKHFKKMY